VLRHRCSGGGIERCGSRRQRAGARTQAPNGGSPGSVTMGDGQGSLAELLIAVRPWNCAGGNGVARAGERGVHGGAFFPTLTGGPGLREETVTLGRQRAGPRWQRH
jgi:hypothetical protein